MEKTDILKAAGLDWDSYADKSNNPNWQNYVDWLETQFPNTSQEVGDVIAEIAENRDTINNGTEFLNAA